MRREFAGVTSVTALAAGLLWGAPAQAEPVTIQEAATVTNASMTWPISDCAFNVDLPACRSLTERQQLAGDVERSLTGWEFFGGDGVVSDSGVMTVAWDATVQLGNTTRGNYTITLSQPVLTVDGTGDGSIVADVTWQIATDTPVTAQGVTIVTFTDAGTDVDFSSTPTEFAPAFIEALDGAAGAGFNLSSWFQQTGSAADPLKLPGQMSVDRWVPTLTVTFPQRFEGKNPRVKDRRFMVSVTGTGFDPAVKANPAVQGVYLVFGTNPATTVDGYTNIEGYFRAKYLPMAPNANGEFTQRIQVRGAYSKNGETFNGRDGAPLGVATWAAHRHATTQWDAFTRIRFRR